MENERAARSRPSLNDRREPTESVWGGGLEAGDELSRLVVEVGAGGGRDRLTGNELLAERVHEGAVVRDAIVEMWARREARGTHVADDLLLPNARAGSDVGRDPREMVVLRLVARPMADVPLDPVAAVPPGVHHDAVGYRANRCADRRPVVDREMGAHAAEDRMRPRVGEARGDAGELERRLEEALPERLAREVVVGKMRRFGLEPDAGERLAAARVLGDEDPAIVDEGLARVALLDEQAEAVSRAGVGGEIEVRGEDLDQGEHEPRRLTGALDRIEQRALHDAFHDFDSELGDRLGPADAPAAILGAGGEGQPRARLVAHRHRLVPSVPGDLARGARPDPSKIGAVLPELRGERSGGPRRQPTPRERLRERIAPPHLHPSDRERIGRGHAS